MATFSPLQFLSARGWVQELRQELIFPAKLHVEIISLRPSAVDDLTTRTHEAN